MDIQDGEGLTVYAGIFQNRIGGDQSAAVNSSPWTDKTTGPKSPLEDANITISSVSEVIMADLIKGSVTVGKYVFDGTVTLQNNTVLVNNGTIENNNSIVNNGTIDSYDGILSGTGTLTVNSGATLVMNANHNGGTDSKLPTMKTIVINAGGFLKSKTTNAESPADNTFIGTDNSARIILTSGAITFGFQTTYNVGQHPTLTIAGNATIPSGMTWYSMYDSGKEAMGIDMTVNGTLTVSGTKSGENNAFVWNSGNELVADDGGKIVIDGIKVSNSGKITVNGLLEIYDGGKLYVGGEHGADTDCQCTLTVGKTGIIVNRGELTVAADGNFPKDSEKETSGKLFNAGMIINEGITNNRITVAGDSVSEGTVSGPGTIFNKGTFVNGGILEYGKFENGSLFINDPDGTVKGKEDSVFFNDGMYVGKKPPVGRSFSDKGSGSENIQIAESIGYGGMNIKVAENSALKVIPINGISGILTAYFGDITVKIRISGGDSLTIAASKAAKPMSNGDPVYGISAAGSSKDMKKTVTVPWSGIGKPSVDRISGGKPAEHVRVIEYSSDSVTFETNGNSSYSVGSDSGPPPAYRDVKLTAGLGTKITCAEGDAFRITGSQTVYFTVLVFKTYTMKENIHSGNAEITHMGNGLYRMSDVVGNVNLTVSTVSEADPEGTGNGSMNLALVAMAFSGVTLALIGFVAHMKKD